MTIMGAFKIPTFCNSYIRPGVSDLGTCHIGEDEPKKLDLDDTEALRQHAAGYGGGAGDGNIRRLRLPDSFTQTPKWIMDLTLEGKHEAIFDTFPSFMKFHEATCRTMLVPLALRAERHPLNFALGVS